MEAKMKRLVITGASRGIGRAIALRFAKKGNHLILQGRDEKALGETCHKIEANGGKATPVLAEFRRLQGIDALVETAAAGIDHEPLHLLVNNAGIAVVKPFAEITPEEWQASLMVNVTAPFLLTRQLAPLMTEGASIVNILSIAARTGFPNWSSYCACKFALEGFSQSIRQELRDRGIRVINLYPGATDTDIWNKVSGHWPREKMIKPDEIAEAVYYAVQRPPAVAVENLTLGNISGTL
jgi:NAD(P)-dependent dehydrogenase (short-subunit alcohol dehydrogenase family)